MNRKTLIVANWKMNHGVEDSLKFFAQFTRQPLSLAGVDVAICPPFTSLYTAGVALQDTGIALGAQNCHFEDTGAYTGEVSAAFLKELGCDYVIVGHSERRQIFGEINADIAKKLTKVLEHNMTPIFCVGETDEERKAGNTFRVIEKQMQEGMTRLDRESAARIVFAYEPVWAIGTGNTATPEQAQEVHAFIRGLLHKAYGTAVGGQSRVLYGGSVKPENVRALMTQPDIDGGLVGGASLEADQFIEIVRQGASVVK